MKFLSPSLPINELPLLPQMHDGRHESLALIKTLVGGRCLVLRLWPAYIQLQSLDIPLWLGNIAELHKETVVGMLAFAKTKEDFKEPLLILSEDNHGLLQRHATELGVVLLWVEK